MIRSLDMILAVCLSSMLASKSPVQLSKVAVVSMNRGDYTVSAGPVRIAIDPRAGATIDSFSFAGYEFLTGRNVHAEFYGSTFWPSPQSDWNWPPPPVLSAGPYEAKVDGDTLTLISGKDPVTGFQFTKRFYLGTGSRMDLVYEISNVSSSGKKVAPWEITRVRKGGLLFFPAGNYRLGKKSFAPVQVQMINGVAWYEDPKSRPAENLLTTADGTEGWAGYAIDGRLFLKKFPVVTPHERAPGEGGIVVYVSAMADYVEFEIQGRYLPLEPGESSEWKVEWIVANIPGNLRIKAGSKELVEFARDLLK